MIFPVLGEGWNFEQVGDEGGVGGFEFFGDVEAVEVGDGDCLGVARDGDDFVTGGDFAGFFYGEIEAAAAAREETFDHEAVVKANAEFETREARLGYGDFGGTDLKNVADVDRGFEQALSGEILSEGGDGQVAAG